MIWRTSKPSDNLIVALLSDSWGGRYTVLYKGLEDLYYEDGEEVPITAIRCWASLQSGNTKSGVAVDGGFIEFEDGTFMDLCPDLNKPSFGPFKNKQKLVVEIIELN